MRKKKKEKLMNLLTCIKKENHGFEGVELSSSCPPSGEEGAGVLGRVGRQLLRRGATSCSEASVTPARLLRLQASRGVVYSTLGTTSGARMPQDR